MNVSAYANVGYVIIASIPVLGGWLKWGRPRWKTWRTRRRAVDDAIAGRSAIVDSITGKELSPALPALGVRMANMESVLGDIKELLASQQIQNQRLDDHETRLKNLEDNRIEQLVSKAESAHMWKAIANNESLDEGEAGAGDGA